VWAWERVDGDDPEKQMNHPQDVMKPKLSIGKMKSTMKFAAVLAAVALIPGMAQAHHMPGEIRGFNSGLSHPFMGLDHVLAMLAVGLWASQMGGRARWAVPMSFVGVMAMGGLLGMNGVALPGVEAGILASVLVLGLLIASAVRVPVIAGSALVAFFALFHGHAHGTEIAAGVSGFGYAGGFLVATAALHAAGLVLGSLAVTRPAGPVLRYAGAAIAVAGVCLGLS